MTNVLCFVVYKTINIICLHCIKGVANLLNLSNVLPVVVLPKYLIHLNLVVMFKLISWMM